MLKFHDLIFTQDKENVTVRLYDLFYRSFPLAEFKDSIGEYSINDDKLKILGLAEEDAEKKFMRFFSRCKTDLRYSLNGNRAIFVDESLGIPLFGLNFLGIVDKGSEMIEVKPITNCNADCNFCSVDEGISSDKKLDFVVDCDFLVGEIRSLLAFKDTPAMSIWINPHGEPTLYSKLVGLCDGILVDHHVKDLSIITNGILLNKTLINSISDVSKKHKKEIKLAVSLSVIEDKALAKKMMGHNYSCDVIVNNLDYASRHMPVSLTPVFLCWMNDDEIVKIIRMAQNMSERKGAHKVKVLIQKFCENKRGRNPIKEQSWEDFFKKLKHMEDITHEKLAEELGKLNETPELPSVCEKGDRLKVRVVCPGRYPKDRIGILETPDGSRAVQLLNCKVDSGTVKVEIVQCKHNMIVAKCF